jgi:glycosyltransferase involved in cell wall biosynthesis
MRVLFALPGFHRYDRGAEIALISVARELTKGGDAVTLIGSGLPRPSTPYRFLRAPSLAREYFETFPSIPLLRSPYSYEELTFMPGLLSRYRPADYDITLTCSYPLTNWLLRHPIVRRSHPPHVFVTQNGDWPAWSRDSEFRFFSCDGLVCTNPDFYERNKSRWLCRLIPNGVDCDRFRPDTPTRNVFGIPEDRLLILIVSALIPSKRVGLGIEIVSRINDAYLLVLGDGPLRTEIDRQAAQRLPGRFKRMTLAPEQMPLAYRSADVLLHLAKDEAFGNIFLEAMASGLPIVAHDSPRTRWITGDDECLVDTENLDATAAIIEMASKSGFTDRVRRVERAKTFSWSKIVVMYRQFLEQVTGSAANQ